MAKFSFKSNNDSAISKIYINETSGNNEWTINKKPFIVDFGSEVINKLIRVDLNKGFKITGVSISTSSGGTVDLIPKKVDEPLYPNSYTFSSSNGISQYTSTYDRTFTFNIEAYTPPVKYGKIAVIGEHVTVKMNDVSIPLSDIHSSLEYTQLEVGRYTYTVTVDRGYKIVKSYSYNDGGPEAHSDDEEVIDIISDDGKTVTKSVTVGVGDVLEYYIDVIVSQPTAPPDTPPVVAFNHIYKGDLDVLKSLTGERFEFKTGDPDNPIEHDLGKFIINVIELPTVIPSEYLGLPDKMALGKYTIKTNAINVLADEIIINIGKIEIPKIFNNSYDYLNTDVTLHLPFTESIVIDPTYCIGETLSIEYLIDLYTGSATINIISSKTNKVIITNRFNIGRNIPFITSTEKQIGNLTERVGLNNRIFTAYVEVTRNPVINNEYDNNITVNGKLNDVKGFITVDEITLNVDTTLREQNDIISQLKQGVRIK